MPLKKKPVTGMKDILPAEMQIRDYVTGLIKETYKSFGFSPIETPCVEHIENLCSKQGGDNEKLIFKIMKRGEKLNLETAQSEADLTDSGLRPSRSDDCTAPGCSTNAVCVVSGAGNRIAVSASPWGSCAARAPTACNSCSPMRPLHTTKQFSAV